jgi:hypothetical protein
MKFNFKKVSAIASSVLLTGMTLGVAAAANFPSGFDDSSAVVYGASADALDAAQANSIASYIASQVDTTTSLSGGEGVTEDEVALGLSIKESGYKIETNLTDGKISSLLDEKISWDDGNGADDYDVHEVIHIGTMNVVTTLNDEDLDGVALTNEEGITYKYVFDNALNTTAIGTDDADTLYLTILGQEYEIESLGTSSITVVTSTEKAFSIGESYVFEGATVTVDDIFSGSVQVNGEIIDDGQTKKLEINGVKVRVQVDDIGYHDNSPETSKAILKIGSDISKTYTSGEEYIGEDEDDPLWVWEISDPTADGGYIGVKYNVDMVNADDDDAGDSVKYVGEAYVLPENFAQVKLDATTDVDYEDFKISFAEKDLYNETGADAVNSDKKVVKIEGPETSSIHINSDSEETDAIYLFYAKSGSETAGGTSPNGTIEVFYRDHDEDATPTNRLRFEENYNLTSANILGRTNIGYLQNGDTDVDMDIQVTSDGRLILYLEDPLDGDITVNITGTAISQTAGTLEQLGTTEEDADANDVIINGTDVSTKDVDEIMNYYGIIVKDVESNADSDEVEFSIPSDRVYAEVSVTAGGSSSTTGVDAGSMVFTDAEKSSWQSKDVVLVGGSCINSATAEALGVSLGTCADAFTTATSIGSGQYLIQSIDGAFSSGKTAIVVAGYSKDDTAAAASRLVTGTVDTTAGKKYLGVVGVQGTSTLTEM